MPSIYKFAGLIVAYLVAAKIGLVFGSVSSSASLFWPPSGIALAALLLGGARYLPAVALAVIVAALMLQAPWLFTLGFIAGYVLEPWLGHFLIQRFDHVNPALDRLRDLFRLILFGGLLPAIAGALCGPLTLLGAGMIEREQLADVMWQWWRADVLGVAFSTPIILVFARKKSKFFKGIKTLEMGALWLISFVIGQGVFLGWQLPGIQPGEQMSITWVLPLLIWAGLRAGRRNTALIQLLFMAQVMAGAYLEKGYFSDNFARYGLSNFWMFAMLLAVAGMALAILTTAQRKAMSMNALNAKVFEVSSNGIIIADANNDIVEVNPAFTALTGYSRDEVLGKNPRLLSSGRQPPEFYAELWKSIHEHGHWQGELWDRRKDGAAFLVNLAIHEIRNGHGRVVNRISIFSDITQSKAEQESVAHQAQHDYLTNLPNRLLFSDRFSQQLAAARRYSKRFAVMYIDLDRFKPVNDTLGHQVGDLLLIAVAERLKAQVREVDTVSRLGGDEFAILISDVSSREDVTNLAEKLLGTLSQPFLLGNHTVSISGSLGIAMYPDNGGDMDTLMNKADAAMYQAKNSGANVYCCAV